MGPFLLLAGTFLLMWVLFILPQQRRLRAHQALVHALEVGDEVMTTAGVYGTITAIDGEDDVVHLEIAPGTVIRLARGAVAQRLGDDAGAVAQRLGDDAGAAADEPARPSGTAADRALDQPAPEQPDPPAEDG